MINFLILFLIALIYSVNCDISYVLNPNCSQFTSSCNPSSSKQSATNLVYVKSNQNDTHLHFILTTVGDYPGFLIYRTSQTNQSITVNWDNLMKDSCNATQFVSSHLFGSIAVIIEGIYFHSNNLSQPYPSNHVTWSEFIWEGVQQPLNCDADQCYVELISKLKNDSKTSGTIIFKVKIKSEVSRNDVLPQILFNPNSTLIELKLENFTTIVNQSRPVIELRVITPSVYDKLLSTKSNDDEYSPGMFESITLLFNNSNQDRSYVYWKPIVYMSEDRIIAKSLSVINSEIVQANVTHQNKPINCFYQNQTYHSYLFNVTFGDEADSYYPSLGDPNGSKMVSFTFLFGLGDASHSQFSLAMLICMYVGFGLPLLIMLIGILYIGIKKVRPSRPDNEVLIQDILDY